MSTNAQLKTDTDQPIEQRKQEEIAWANFRYSMDEKSDDFKKYGANEKYYSINRSVHIYLKDLLIKYGTGKDVLELACGAGALVLWVSDKVKSAIACDIAPVAIEEARAAAAHLPGAKNMKFEVRDCEKTGFPDNSFDLMVESGALHHMDLDVVYAEAARILRPGGHFICGEAIRHNPIIHLYRKMTPHLRTPWEVPHILARKDVMKGLKYFDTIEVRNFHMMTIFAVPFRNTKIFGPLLKTFEAIDSVLTRIPGFKWLSWQCIFVLSNPRKK